MGTAKDLGPLDWRTPIVDSSGCPSPQFQRLWDAQRGNNDAIGSVAIGSGAPTGTPDDGQAYVDIAARPPAVYVGSGGTWLQVGVVKFVQLADVPSGYTGAGGKLVQVNAGATGLQFAGISQVLDLLGATQGSLLYRSAAGWVVLAPGAAGQLLSSGGAAANPAWANAPAANIQTLLDSIGNVQGSVLYRGAAGWVVLAPGTAGQVLTSGGAGANPSWAAGGGGGGGPATECAWTAPVLSSFTQQNFGGSTTATVNALGGITLNDPGFGSDNNQLRALLQAVPTTTPWTAYARIRRNSPLMQFIAGGIVVRNAANGKSIIFGENDDHAGVGFANLNSDTSFSSDGSYAGSNDRLMDIWYSFSYDGTNIKFSMSRGGESFVPLFITTAAASFLGAAPTHVGFGMNANNPGSGSTTTGPVNYELLSWSFTAPAA